MLENIIAIQEKEIKRRRKEKFEKDGSKDKRND